MPALGPWFTASDAAFAQLARDLTPVRGAPTFPVTEDEVGLLREGLGRIDMDIRWMAHLDEVGTLRLWRSWTGHQIYQAHLSQLPGQPGGVLRELQVVPHTDDLPSEPATFEMVLRRCVLDQLREFRAGGTPGAS